MPIAKLATLEDVRRGGYFKYVRMADDTFRFAAVGPGLITPRHSDMIGASESAKSAGGVITDPSCGGGEAVITRREGARVVMRGSMTLSLPTKEDDERMIAVAVFGPERR